MSLSTSALVVIDVQNEFMSPNGNFPCPDDVRETLTKNLSTLVPRFRGNGGHIIWIKAIYENRTEEPLGKTQTIKGTNEWLQVATHFYEVPCCESGSFGAEIYPEVLALAAPQDALVTKIGYSAFWETTALLDVLRAKCITDAYFSGLASGTCVLASVLDAIKIGEVKVHAVPDAMGWRRFSTHVNAIERMQQLPVRLVNSDQI